MIGRTSCSLMRVCSDSSTPGPRLWGYRLPRDGICRSLLSKWWSTCHRSGAASVGRAAGGRSTSCCWTARWTRTGTCRSWRRSCSRGWASTMSLSVCRMGLPAPRQSVSQPSLLPRISLWWIGQAICPTLTRLKISIASWSASWSWTTPSRPCPCCSPPSRGCGSQTWSCRSSRSWRGPWQRGWGTASQTRVRWPNTDAVGTEL